MPALLLDDDRTERLNTLMTKMAFISRSTSSIVLRVSLQDEENADRPYALIGYNEACSRSSGQLSTKSKIVAIASADRGDEEDYEAAAVLVLDELENGTYQNEYSRGFEYSLLGALSKMVDYLVRHFLWDVFQDEDRNLHYVDTASGELTTPTIYLRAKGVPQFRAQFGCFLHDRARELKQDRLTQQP